MKIKRKRKNKNKTQSYHHHSGYYYYYIFFLSFNNKTKKYYQTYIHALVIYSNTCASSIVLHFKYIECNNSASVSLLLFCNACNSSLIFDSFLDNSDGFFVVSSYFTFNPLQFLSNWWPFTFSSDICCDILLLFSFLTI